MAYSIPGSYFFLAFSRSQCAAKVRLLNVLPRSGVLEKLIIMSAPIIIKGALVRVLPSWLWAPQHARCQVQVHWRNSKVRLLNVLPRSGVLEKLMSSPFMVMGVLMMSFSNAPELVGVLEKLTSAPFMVTGITDATQALATLQNTLGQVPMAILSTSVSMATIKTRPTPTGTGISNVQAPTPANKTRMSHRNTVSLLLPKDEILQQDYEVKDKDSGTTYLEKSPFRQISEPMSNESLVLTILHITQYTGIPRIAIEGLRVVALLLEDSLKTRMEAPPSIQQLTDSLLASLSAQLVLDLSNTLSSHVIAAILPQVATILTASETLKSNVDEIAKFKTIIETNLKEDSTSISAAAKRAELVADAVLSSITDVKGAIESLTAPPPSTAQSNTTRSYSAVVQHNTQTLAPISAALTHASTRDRQILFDPTPGKALFTPEVPSADIATKMKQVLTTSESDATPDILIKAIMRLRNGGLIVELTTIEAATWIRTPENRLKVIAALGIPTTIKDRCFSVIVPFLPITSSVEDPIWLRTVEEENSMSLGAIESANWIKP
ncbi:hypothetical protein F4604DRAFT_1915726 [Suillus subluteus]|nr:hypothetical protein F4604DRAFT_1915726 [Suillus subluteus]